ncbi:MAG: hypothetical protein NC935_04360 [Candidatus Omnitrophica bacterium]|nr:hypothetical protein [Candidatus Omnitrophota bacterium]
MKNIKRYAFLVTMMFFVFNFFLINIKAESETKPEEATQLNIEDNAFEPLIKAVNEALTKLGNKRLAVLGFASGEGASFIKETIMISDRVIQALIASGLFEIVDRTLLGFDNVANLNIENAKKWSDTLNLGSVLTGTVFKKGANIELNWRLIGLKDLTILSVGTLSVKNITMARDGKSNLIDFLTEKINEIKATNLAPEIKEKGIIKTIAEFLRPAPGVEYTYTFFPCDIATLVCNELNLNDGFYKIYYKDEFVVTVDKKGNILESYYYGKNNPVRKDIDLEKFLNKSN